VSTQITAGENELEAAHRVEAERIRAHDGKDGLRLPRAYRLARRLVDGWLGRV